MARRTAGVANGVSRLVFLPEQSFGCIGNIAPCLGRQHVAPLIIDLSFLAADCCRTCTKMPDHVGCDVLHKIAIFHCIPASLLQAAGIRFSLGRRQSPYRSVTPILCQRAAASFVSVMRWIGSVGIVSGIIGLGR